MKPRQPEDEKYFALIFQSMEKESRGIVKIRSSGIYHRTANIMAYRKLIRRRKFKKLLKTFWRNQKTNIHNFRYNVKMKKAAKSAENGKLSEDSTLPVKVPEHLMSAEEKARYHEKNYFSDKQIAVYTCLFGDYDEILEPPFVPDNIDYYIVTDRKLKEGSFWKRVDLSVIPEGIKDPVSKNRWCKMHPDRLFPDYQYSIYIDASIKIFSDLTPLTATVDDYPVAMFMHKNRDCVYEEIDVCSAFGKDSARNLEAYRKILEERGVPKNGGLLEAPLIVRKHHDERCKSLMHEWWEEFGKPCKRDQIVLIGVLARMGIDLRQIGTLKYCGAGDAVSNCDLFCRVSHKKNLDE